MWDRTVTIGSAGKTFSATGWKVGWTIGPQHLIRGLQLVHQNSIYTVPTPLQVRYYPLHVCALLTRYYFVSHQEAVALGFETETARLGQSDCYFSTLPKELIAKRDKLASMLRQIGMKPVVPQGSYFMLADVSQLKQSRNLMSGII